ncbi:phage late control D family protein [Pseudovibrio ascidiaceicola]|uniref:phage late control D family protein n=1 Tax=Pseudovibrio ascidiaceicola TaxID=285279 RepID=UPI003D361CE7
MTPDFKIVRNGKNITKALSAYNSSIEFSDEAEDKADTLAIDLSDVPIDGRYLDMPDIGDEIRLSLGYRETGLTFMGVFIVDAVKLGGDAIMTIDCKSADMTNSFRTPKARSWHMKTVGDIAKQIAKENNYEPLISKDLADIIINHADQFQESDMSFLNRLASLHDATAKPAGGKLFINPRGQGKSAIGEKLPEVTISRSEVSGDWTYRYSARDEKGAAGDLPGQKKSQRTPGGIRARYYNLKSAKTENVDVGSAPFRELRYPFRNKIEATAAANAIFNSQTRGRSELSFSCPGRTDLAAEVPIRLKGWRPGIPTLWRSKSVRHSLGPSGYVCAVSGDLFEESKDVSTETKKASKSQSGWVGDR